MRNAHQVVHHAQATIRQGYGWVVDIDLETLFGRANLSNAHDRPIARMRQHVDAANNVLSLIDAFSKAGYRWAAGAE